MIGNRQSRPVSTSIGVAALMKGPSSFLADAVACD
jgi:hypothetical protein